MVHPVIHPRLTIPITQMSTPNTYYMHSISGLSEIAVKRTVIVHGDNTLGTYLTVSCQMWDSASPLPSDGQHFRSNNEPTESNVDGSYPAIFDSESFPALKAGGDTLLIIFQTGATVDTSGNYYVDVIDVTE